MGPFGSCSLAALARTLPEGRGPSGGRWVRLMGDVMRPWAIRATEVAASLASDPSRGLTSVEAAARLAIQGPNELAARGVKPVWILFAEQFASAMIVVLLAAGVITALLGDLKDTFVILAIVALNGIVGFVRQALFSARRDRTPPACICEGVASTRGRTLRSLPSETTRRRPDRTRTPRRP